MKTLNKIALGTVAMGLLGVALVGCKKEEKPANPAPTNTAAPANPPPAPTDAKKPSGS